MPDRLTDADTLIGAHMRTTFGVLEVIRTTMLDRLEASLGTVNGQPDAELLTETLTEATQMLSTIRGGLDQIERVLALVRAECSGLSLECLQALGDRHHKRLQGESRRGKSLTDLAERTSRHTPILPS